MLNKVLSHVLAALTGAFIIATSLAYKADFVEKGHTDDTGYTLENSWACIKLND